MNKITVVYCDVENGKAPVKAEIADELKEYYRLINCDTIDIVHRSIKDVQVCVVLDDNGRFKESPRVSGVNIARTWDFVGNIIITGCEDSEGNLTSLTVQDCKKISERIAFFSLRNGEQRSFILFD